MHVLAAVGWGGGPCLQVDSDAGLQLVGPGSTGMEREEVQKLICNDRGRGHALLHQTVSGFQTCIKPLNSHHAICK